MATDIIPAQPKTKKGKGYTATGNEEVEVASKPSKHVTYLKNTLGTILPQCLHEVCQKRPRDPIEFIALCLYKSVDCELYFYEKAIFSKELQLMALELKKENTVRQSNIEKIKKKIQELKVLLRGDKKIEAMLWMEARKKSLLMAEEEEEEEHKEPELNEEAEDVKVVVLQDGAEAVEPIDIEAPEAPGKRTVVASKMRKFSVKKPAKVRKKSSKTAMHRGKYSRSDSATTLSEVDKESYSEEYAMSSKLTSSGEMSEVTTEEPSETTESAVSEQDTEDDKIYKPPAKPTLPRRRSSKKKFKGGLSPEPAEAASPKEHTKSFRFPRASIKPAVEDDIIETKKSKKFAVKGDESEHERTAKKKIKKKTSKMTESESDVAKVKQVEPLGAREGKKPGKKKGRKAEEIPELGAKKQDLKKQKVLEGSSEEVSGRRKMSVRGDMRKTSTRSLAAEAEEHDERFRPFPGEVSVKDRGKFPVDAVSGEDARRADTSPRRAAIPKKRVRGTSLRNELPSPVESPERHLSVSPDTHKTTQKSKRKKSTGQKSKPSKGAKSSADDRDEDEESEMSVMVSGHPDKQKKGVERVMSEIVDEKGAKKPKMKKKDGKISDVGSATDLDSSTPKKFIGVAEPTRDTPSPSGKKYKIKAGKGKTSDVEDDVKEVKTKKQASSDKLTAEEGAKRKKDQKKKPGDEKRSDSPVKSDIEEDHGKKKTAKKGKPSDKGHEDAVGKGGVKKSSSKPKHAVDSDKERETPQKKIKEKHEDRADVKDKDAAADARTKGAKQTPQKLKDGAAEDTQPKRTRRHESDVRDVEQIIPKQVDGKKSPRKEWDSADDYQKRKEQKAQKHSVASDEEFTQRKKKVDKGRGSDEDIKKIRVERETTESEVSEEEYIPKKKKEDRKSHRDREIDEDLREKREEKGRLKSDASEEDFSSRKKKEDRKTHRDRESDEDLRKKREEKGRLKSDASEEDFSSRKKKEDRKSHKEKRSEEDFKKKWEERGRMDSDVSDIESIPKKKKEDRKSRKGQETEEEEQRIEEESVSIASDVTDEEAIVKKEDRKSHKEKGIEEDFKKRQEERGGMDSDVSDIESIPKKKKEGRKSRKGLETEEEEQRRKESGSIASDVTDEESIKKRKEEKGKLESGASEEDLSSRKKKEDRKSQREKGSEDLKKKREETGRMESDVSDIESIPRKKKEDRKFRKGGETEEEEQRIKEEGVSVASDVTDEEAIAKKKKEERKSRKGRGSEEDLRKRREEKGRLESDASDEDFSQQKKKEDRKSQKRRESEEDLSKKGADSGRMESVSEETKRKPKEERLLHKETDDLDAKKKGDRERLESYMTREDEEGTSKKRKGEKRAHKESVDVSEDKDYRKKLDDLRDQRKEGQKTGREKEESGRYVESTSVDDDRETHRKRRIKSKEQSSEDKDGKDRKLPEQEQFGETVEDEWGRRPETKKARHEKQKSGEETRGSPDRADREEESSHRRKGRDSVGQVKSPADDYDDISSADVRGRSVDTEKDRETLKHKRRTTKGRTDDGSAKDVDEFDRPVIVRKGSEDADVSKSRPTGSSDQVQKVRRHKDKPTDEPEAADYPDAVVEKKREKRKTPSSDKSLEKLGSSPKLSLPQADSDRTSEDYDVDDSEDERKRKKRKKAARKHDDDEDDEDKRHKFEDSEVEESRKTRPEEDDTVRSDGFLLKKKSSFLGPEDDYQRGFSLSDTKKIRSRKRLSKVLTPIMCEWYLDKPRVLVCRHPVLGEIRSHQPLIYSVLETPNYWDHEEFNCEVFYEHEIYSVCDPRADDDQFTDRMMEWHEGDWNL